MKKIIYSLGAIILFSLPIQAVSGVLGDINADGKIDLQEAIYALQVVAGIKSPINTDWDVIFSDNFNRSDKMLNDDVTYKIQTCCGDDKNLFIKNMKITGSSSGDGNTSFAQLIQSFDEYNNVRVKALADFVGNDTHVAFYLFDGITYFFGSFEPMSISIFKGSQGSAPVPLAFKSINLNISKNYLLELVSTSGDSMELNIYDASGTTKLESLSVNDNSISHKNISIAMGDSDVIPPYATLDNLLVEKFE